MIVFSILLAFAIDAAWDERQERRSQAVIREALIADFETIRELLPDHLLDHERTAAATTGFIDLVRDLDEGVRVMVPDSMIFFGIRNSSFDAPTGALDALLSSGELRLIEDPELRRMLAAWPFRLKDATEDDRLLREFWGPELRAILSEDTNLLVPVGPRPPGASMEIRVTNRMRGVLPDVRGSSRLALNEERSLMLFLDSLLVRLRAGR